MSGEQELRKVMPVRVSSLKDLVRLTMTYTSSGQTIFLIKFFDKDKLVIGMLGLFRDYYKLYGLPILYYHVCDDREREKILNANYIIISSTDESLEFSKTPRPGLSIPVISLAEKPSIIPDLCGK